MPSGGTSTRSGLLNIEITLPPVPGDLDGDRDVDLDDLRLLSASRPDDVELATIVDNL